MFILSFPISFVCLVVILLILSVIPLWNLAAAQSPSGKEFNPPSIRHKKPASANISIAKVLSFEFSPLKMSYMDNA